MKDEKNAIGTSIEFIDWLITWWEKEEKESSAEWPGTHVSIAMDENHI